MNEPILQSLLSLEPSETSHAARRSLGCRDSRDAIRRRLEAVGSRIDEAIASCARRESLGDQVEAVAPWQFVPRHLTEIDSLRGLRNHLDHLAARLQRIIPLGNHPDSSDPIIKIDRALDECTRAMESCFEVPDVCHDLQADVESELCRFESLLDARALLYPEDGRHRPKDRPHDEWLGSAAGSMDATSDRGVQPECVRLLKEYRAVLRCVDGHIARTEADPPYQKFWRGVKQGYREEIERSYPPTAGAPPRLRWRSAEMDSLQSTAVIRKPTKRKV